MLIVFCTGAVFSQTQPPPQRPSPTPPPRPVDGTFRNQNDSPLTTFEEEIRAKREIKMAEKDHQENLERAREIGEIGKVLKESIKAKSTLDRDCLKKIERLEKLTKKVRSEAGGEDEEITTPRPTDLAAAITQIAEASDTLSKDVQNTPRRVVSASVISHANVLLELIKIARTIARPQQ
ncbi:MAG TPA: hypothetical protein VKB02_09075 [Pyrinomonadaceae bacterium]|nr:hypothetical protein [Pyrinomonadaceae bacterium]